MSRQDTRGIIDLALTGDTPHQVHSIFNIFLPHYRAEVARFETKEISAKFPVKNAVSLKHFRWHVRLLETFQQTEEISINQKLKSIKNQFTIINAITI